MKKICNALLCLVISASVHAATEKDSKTEPVGWSGDVGLGYVTTSGASETETLNSKANAKYHFGQGWFSKTRLEALKSEKDAEISAERYLFVEQVKNQFDNSNFAYVTGKYEDTKGNGYDYQATLSLGYGRRIYEATDVYVDGEIGPGLKYSEPEEGSDTSLDGILSTRALLGWTISPTTQFTQVFSVEAGEEEIVLESETGLETIVVGSLSTKLGYRRRHTSDPLLSASSVEDEAGVTVSYKF